MNAIDFKKSLSDCGNHLVLIVDDIEDNVFILQSFLNTTKYRTMGAYKGQQALDLADEHQPDLILLDLGLPDMSGIEVLKKLRSNPKLLNTGIIIVTAASAIEDVIQGFTDGADDFIKKPYHHLELLARMRSVLSLRDTYDQLRIVNNKLDDLNRGLETTVQEQVQELEKANSLKRFLSPQVVDNLMTDSESTQLTSERREVTVVFLDLRGFTSYADSTPAANIMASLSHMHAIVGPVIFKYHATLERFTGDGLMCIVGAPNDVDEHPQQALLMAMEMRQAYIDAQKESPETIPLELSIGISTGVATTGAIGFEGRLDYAAIGSVTNMASRLCSIADPNEILLSEFTYSQLSDPDKVTFKGDEKLKGFSNSTKFYSI